MVFKIVYQNHQLFELMVVPIAPSNGLVQLLTCSHCQRTYTINNRQLQCAIGSTIPDHQIPNDPIVWDTLLVRCIYCEFDNETYPIRLNHTNSNLYMYSIDLYQHLMMTSRSEVSSQFLLLCGSGAESFLHSMLKYPEFQIMKMCFVMDLTYYPIERLLSEMGSNDVIVINHVTSLEKWKVVVPPDFKSVVVLLNEDIHQTTSMEIPFFIKEYPLRKLCLISPQEVPISSGSMVQDQWIRYLSGIDLHQYPLISGSLGVITFQYPSDQSILYEQIFFHNQYCTKRQTVLNLSIHTPNQIIKVPPDALTPIIKYSPIVTGCTINLLVENPTQQLAIEALLSVNGEKYPVLTVLYMISNVLVHKRHNKTKIIVEAEGQLPLYDRTIGWLLETIVQGNHNLGRVEALVKYPSIYDGHMGTYPSISISQYVHRIVTHTMIKKEILIIMLIYLDRFIAYHPTHRCLQPENIHRLVFCSYLLTCKFNNDHYYSNRFYSKVAGVPLSELNDLEVSFFTDINHDLVVSSEIFQTYTQVVELISCMFVHKPDKPQPKQPHPERHLGKILSQHRQQLYVK